MNKLSIKSNIVLGALALLTLIAFIAVENTKVMVEQQWYEEKLAAAELAKKAADHLKQTRLSQGVFIDVVNDPNETAMIGQEFTMITTDRGSIDAKLISTNPNFAAAIVEMLKEAGLKKDEKVAIAFTGSFPALNLATLAAMEVLELQPVIITSVGASNWGANDPWFTWLDMEKALYDAGIFHFRSVAASIGGGKDRGRGLSPDGRDLIIEAIKRNNVRFIDQEHLENSIQERMEIYDEHSGVDGYKCYINVGGGIASLGATINGRIIPSGLSEKLLMKNFPVPGVIIQMAKKNIPIIHLLRVKQLVRKYQLSPVSVPLPLPGEGEIFIEEKYSLILTAVLTVILAAAIAFVFIMERKRHKPGEEKVPGLT